MADLNEKAELCDYNFGEAIPRHRQLSPPTGRGEYKTLGSKRRLKPLLTLDRYKLGAVRCISTPSDINPVHSSKR